MDSILNLVKKKAGGISTTDTSFDDELIMDINSVFAILTQMGIGPEEGFVIANASTEWSAFTDDNIKLNLVKTYMGLKVRLMFDPPLSSTVLNALQANISECESRLYMECNPGEPATE